MSLRAVQEFVVHFESFRNIDLWYQGAYMVKFQIYAQSGPEKQKEKIYAHPFAFTEHYMATEQQGVCYDSQILKSASIDSPSSSFLSKSFLLRYYEQQVELNDLCHFRIETDISRFDTDFVLECNLLFFDQQVKKLDPQEITVENGKCVKTKKYVLRQTKSGTHQYIPVVFDTQYYSIANLMLHSVCLDYRFRLCKLQLYEFVKLNPTDKKKLLDKNRKMNSQGVAYYKTVATQLNVTGNPLALQIIEDIVVKDMKKHYHVLLKQYSTLFARVIGEQHRKRFPQLIVPPAQLGLFEDESFSRGSTWQQKLFKRYKCTTEEQAVEKMLNEVNLISAQLIKLWHHFIDVLKMSPRFSTAHYQAQYYENMQLFWQKFRKFDHEYVNDICISSREIDQIHDNLEKELSASRMKVSLDFNIFNEEWINKKNVFPLMVENCYSKNNQLEVEKVGKERSEEMKVDVSLHLVVLVHGFQGNSLDMKIIKNSISVLYPEASFLCASSNQDMTDTDIIQMGHRLATEIKNHVIEFFPPDTLERISFIGHSLGGVIIRAALPKLLDYRNKFHTFITFSSPHIGYKVNASSVIQAGIWVLQKFKNSLCLKQLTMSDTADPRQTILYRISQFQGLKHFKNIFLFSSKQDSYAPYESARIQIHPDFMNAKDPLKQVHCEMVRSILNGVSREQLHRIRVNFTIEQTNIDSIIGRTAHILFLENTQLIQLFLHTHPDLFC